MATATIRIDQATHATQPAGVAGRARDDLEIDEVVTLRSTTNSGVTSWRWQLRSKPTGSTAALSNPIASLCTFTPDMEGSYLVWLSVNDGLEGEVAKTVAVVRDSDGLRIPAAEEDTEANWLVSGVPNTRGWHPDLEAYLLFLRSSLSPTDFSASVAYDIDFTALAPGALPDGPNTIGDRTWTSVNVDDYADSCDINGSGLVIYHATGDITEIAGNDLAPRVTIPLVDLIEDYDPTARYIFLAQYSWIIEPDADGERFSLGFYAPDDSPWPGSSLRFAGASVGFTTGDSGDGITHEGERGNVITVARAPEQPVLGVGLEAPTELAVWQSEDALPALTIRPALVPVVGIRADDPVAAGDPDIFSHPDVLFVMSVASASATGTHAVAIARLRVIKVSP
jgi:hypothetical protein